MSHLVFVQDFKGCLRSANCLAATEFNFLPLDVAVASRERERGNLRSFSSSLPFCVLTTASSAASAAHSVSGAHPVPSPHHRCQRRSREKRKSSKTKRREAEAGLEREKERKSRSRRQSELTEFSKNKRFATKLIAYITSKLRSKSTMKRRRRREPAATGALAKDPLDQQLEDY